MYACLASESITDEERERLILEHLPQVRLIAWRILERLPDSVVLEDLISAGVIGLIAAVDNFDPGHNVKLRTYAKHKIRGAILDSLRAMDWAPREQRRRAKQIEAAVAAVEQRFKRSSTAEEIAAQLDISIDEYHEWLVEIRGLNISSLECAAGDQGKDLLSGLLERAELERIMTRAIGGAPHRADGAEPVLSRGDVIAGDRKDCQTAHVASLATEVSGHFDAADTTGRDEALLARSGERMSAEDGRMRRSLRR
jgi:RNA polymerase sigma factor for flagellar operon FliA